MTPKRNKRVIVTTPRDDLKSVRFPPSVSTDTKSIRLHGRVTIADRPVWSLKAVDIDGPWCWSVMAAGDLKLVVQHLGNFETMTWRQIGCGGSHSVAVPKLCKEARDRLTHLRLDDLDELYSFRITGLRRMLGIRRGDIVELLWWDPEHQVCPSVKKHT